HGSVAWVVECEICGSEQNVLTLARSRLTRGFSPAEESQFLHVGSVPTEAPSPAPATTPGPSASPPAPASAVPSPAPTPPTPPPVASYDDGSTEFCDADNGTCDLAPGLYRPKRFAPTFAIRLGTDWRLDGETERTVNLLYRGDIAYVDVLS